MENFSISFMFGQQHHLADVAVIHGKDHIQYSISPRDKDLLEKYATQVVHVFSGEDMEFAFPGSSEEKLTFTNALADGLLKYLKSR